MICRSAGLRPGVSAQCQFKNAGSETGAPHYFFLLKTMWNWTCGVVK